MNIRTILRFVLAVVFGYAGIAKLREPEVLAQAIASLGWLPRWVINPMAIGLPVFEILCAGLMILMPFRLLTRVGALGIAFLLLIFTAVWIYVGVTGKAFSCSCFGADSMLNFGGPVGAVIRNLILLAAAAWVYATTSQLPPARRTQNCE